MLTGIGGEKETSVQPRIYRLLGTVYAPTRAQGPTVVYGGRVDAADRIFAGSLAATWLVGVFLSLYRLGFAGWGTDERIYAESGRAYLAGDFASNPEHPPLVKYILGVAQAVGGSNATAVRLPGALCGLLTGLFLFLIARRLAGRWAGLSVLALWSLMPHPFGELRVERFALLEPYMVLFVVMAIWAGERWASTASWKWATAAGVASGLAASCKVPGVLAIAVIASIGVCIAKKDARFVEQLGAIIAIAVAVFLATYLPFGGSIGSTLSEMWSYQDRHSLNGHPIAIAGTVYSHPPWWASFWLFWTKGQMAAVAYGTLLLVAPFVLSKKVAIPVLTFVAVWFLFFSFVSTFVLRHYLYAVTPALALAGGLVLYRLFVGEQRGMLAVGMITAAMLATGSASAVRGVVETRARPSSEPSVYANAANLINGAGLSKAHVAVYGSKPVAAAYLPAARIISPSQLNPKRDVVVVDRTFMRAHFPGWHIDPIRRRLTTVLETPMVERSVGGSIRVFIPAAADQRLRWGAALDG